MKFNLLDKIESISDTRIVALKQVTLAEEYLADHFPTFPVLPGVFMLEAATQACAWVLYRKSSFAKPLAVLKEAKNVKYGHFVAPGNALRIEADLASETPGGSTFKVTGTVLLRSAGNVEEKTAFTARLELACFTLAEKNPALASLDHELRQHVQSRWALVAPPASGDNPPPVTTL
jgi:3-hydroxyacyl-[acyl-carrier-protein] dehydratase